MKSINLFINYFILLISILLLSCTKPNSPTGYIGVVVVEDIEYPKIWFEIPNAAEPYEGTINVQVHYEDIFGVSYASFYVNNEQFFSGDWHSDYHGFNVNTTNYDNNIVITALVSDEFGNISYAGPDTLSIIKPVIEVIENDVLTGANIGRIIFDESQDNTWLCTDIGLIKTDLNNNWEVFNTSNCDILNNLVHDVLILDDNLLFVGTEHGLNSFNGINWVEEFENPYNHAVLSLEKGNDEIIWTGTEIGLYKYDGLEFEYMYLIPNHYFSEDIFEIKISEDGVPHFATSEGLFRLDNDNNFTEISGYDEYHYSFDFSLDFGIWYIYYNHCETRLYTTSGYHPENDIEAITGFSLHPHKVFVDSRNYVWVTISEGLLKFDGELWTYYNHENSDLPECTLNYIAEDNNGNILISSDDGKIVRVLQ